MATKIKPISIKKKLKAVKMDEMISVKPEQVKEAREYMTKLGSRFSSYYDASGFLVLTRTA